MEDQRERFTGLEESSGSNKKKKKLGSLNRRVE